MKFREQLKKGQIEKAAIKEKIILHGKCLLQFPQVLGKN